MAQLTARILSMESAELANGIRTQMAQLQSLLNYLEDRNELGAKEYLFCQARLHGVLKQLKKLDRMAEDGQRE